MAAQRSPYKIKVGIKDTPIPRGPPKDEWYINDMGRLLGPFTWKRVMDMAERAQITPFARLRNADWQEWAPIWYYVRVKTPGELEAEALIPSRYDGLFFLGALLFIIGIILLIVSPWMGLPLLIVSPIIEFEAVFWESKHKAKATMRSFGNAIAIFWIVMQLFITVFFYHSFL